MKMERIESSETLALKAQTPGDHPKNTIRHSTHGENLKSIHLALPTITQFDLKFKQVKFLVDAFKRVKFLDDAFKQVKFLADAARNVRNTLLVTPCSEV